MFGNIIFLRPKVTAIRLIIALTILQLIISLLSDGFMLSHAESMWHYIGRNWLRHGMVPYSGGVDNKSPMIFLIFGISDKLFGVNFWFPRLVGTICQSIGLYYAYKITMRIAGPVSAMLSIIIYGLSLLWHVTGNKYTAHTETYEVTFTLISIYKFLTAKNKKDLFYSGLFSGSALMFRYSALFGTLVILLYAFKLKTKSALYIYLGFIAAIGGFTLFIIFSGINFHDFFIYSFADNFVPGSITNHNLLWKAQRFVEVFFNSELVLFYPALAGYLFLKRENNFLGLWLLSEFIGISIIGLFSYEHLKDMLPALSIINAIVFAHLIENYKIPAKVITLVISLCFFPKLLEPFIALKKLFVSKSLFTPGAYGLDESSKKQLGYWIKANTTEKDYVLITGFGAQVQAYSERISPSIYFNNTSTTLAKKQFFNDILKTKTTMIVMPIEQSDNLVDADIKKFVTAKIEKDYQFVKTYSGYNIFVLKPK
ncbi:MAG: hypothetical protein JWN76_2061 [Chitinophagaceae bacterium]|nr:hypothetical protein [Chitinophagaceae bacterium]